jgi:hypothetical protein
VNGQSIRDRFWESAKQWVCDSYSLGIYYLASNEKGVTNIVDAAFFLYPIPPERIENFSLQAGNLIAGQQIFPSLPREELLAHLELATRGEILVHGRTLRLAKETEYQYYSEHSHRDTWFTELNLQVGGQRLNPLTGAEAADIDTTLRNATPPFDGMEDLGNWLRLSDRRINGRESILNIRISPPVDMLFEQSSLHDNKFQLSFSAHPKFDVSKVGVSIREFPGIGVKSRKQVGDSIIWSRVKGRHRSGQLKAKLSNADSVLAMLTLGTQTIRRQWFTDPDKALNTRYVATQFFDKELKQLRQALLDSTDSVRFEQAIASLLYLLGFSAAIQVETQAPDILVSSPMGKLAIIECTTKISDFQSKLGKLVDRRNALLASLNAMGNVHRIDAFLVCGLPKSQIAAEEKQLTQHRVTLLCRENLADALIRLRTPTSPDEMLDQAASQLEQARHPIGQ